MVSTCPSLPSSFPTSQTTHPQDCPPFQQCGASQCCSLAQYCSTEDGPAHCVDIPHFAGIGDCQPPQIQNNDDALLAVTCNGPLHTMMPGEASAPDQTVLLGNPYPSNATVVVESMTSQMVDAANNPVLLSEVCILCFTYVLLLVLITTIVVVFLTATPCCSPPTRVDRACTPNTQANTHPNHTAVCAPLRCQYSLSPG